MWPFKRKRAEGDGPPAAAAPPGDDNAAAAGVGGSNVNVEMSGAGEAAGNRGSQQDAAEAPAASGYQPGGGMWMARDAGDTADAAGGASATDGAAAEQAGTGADTSMPGHRSRHSAMLKSRTLVDDDVPPNELDDAAAQAPPFLRGTVLRQYLLKQEIVARVQALIEGVDGTGGILQKFGFQAGERGGARCAVEGLVADIVGRPGSVVSADAAIVELHEKIFENYNHWARFVQGTPVYSVRYDDTLPPGAVAAAWAPSSVPAGAEGEGGRSPLPDSSSAGTGRAGSGGAGSTGRPAASSVEGDAAAEGMDSTGGSGAVAAAAAAEAAVRTGETAVAVSGRDAGAPGSDPFTRLVDLGLWYCIRAEAANLRFMPE
jgi:hypothetical protein